MRKALLLLLMVALFAMVVSHQTTSSSATLVPHSETENRENPRPDRSRLYALPLSKRYQTVRNRAARKGIRLGRHLVIHGRPQDGKIVWALVRKDLRKIHERIKRHSFQQKLARLVRRAQTAPYGRTPDGSRWLVNDANYALFPYVFSESEVGCARFISGRETGGTYDHRVGYGFTWNQPDNGRAYGLGQALPGIKMGQHGPDWRTNPLTQLRWFRSYAIGRYGSVCAAASYHRAHGVW